MRLYELVINEAISLSKLKNPLTKEITDTIMECVHSIYDKERYVPPMVKEYTQENVSLTKLNTIIRAWLEEGLTRRLPKAIELIIDAVLNIETSVFFKDMHPSGSARGIDMDLNSSYVVRMVKEIVTEMDEYIINTLESEDKLYEWCFNCYKTANNRTLYSGYRSNLLGIVEQFVTTIIHELVHNVQHDTQFKKGRTSTEYRSYLEKDKEKFYKAVGKAYSPEGMTPEEYKIYRASPQEIAAFAHEGALKFIDGMDIDRMDLPELAQFKKDLNSKLDEPGYLLGYMDKTFDPKVKKEYPVFKRYNKLYYQEVMKYIDHVWQYKHKLAKRNQSV